MNKGIVTALYALAASILLSALALAWAVRSGPEARADPAEEYRRGKVAEVSSMVLNREIVPGDYFRYLDEELAEAVEEYNSETCSMRSYYMEYAEKNILGLLEFYQECGEEIPSFADSQERIWQAADHISDCALHREPYWLYYQDPVVWRILKKEGGGSGSLWLNKPAWAHNVGTERAAKAEAYFAQVEELLDRLDAACGHAREEPEMAGSSNYAG